MRCRNLPINVLLSISGYVSGEEIYDFLDSGEQRRLQIRVIVDLPKNSLPAQGDIFGA